MACLNTSRVFDCHAGGNCVGTVRGSVAATADVAVKANKIPSAIRMNFSLPGLRCATLPIAGAASSYDAMALRKIFGAAHFLEPAHCALELEAAVARRIETCRFG